MRICQTKPKRSLFSTESRGEKGSAIAALDGTFGFFPTEGDHIGDYFDRSSAFDDVLMGRDTYAVGLKFGVTNLIRRCAHTVLAGQGIPLSRRVPQPVRLELQDTKVYTSGVVLLTYRVVS